MQFKDYPKFSSLLKKIPARDRKAWIDVILEKLGYKMIREAVLSNGQEKWIIKVYKNSKVLFDDITQKFSIKTAIEYSRTVTLNDYEFNAIN
jgi:hypothetical protein